jgi:pimeloyl-ACP methyl ester carboxylesterase
MSQPITPFEISVDDTVLADLHERLERTRWPAQETVDGWSQGIPLAYLREVCEYWVSSYDWRAREAALNRFPQFRTPLSGGGDEPLDIHFLHVRSPEASALPLILSHGWPGSTVEFMEVIGPLTDPVAHGGDAADAFHVVAPSLPGFGFSAKPARPGWGAGRIATAWDELMVRLGYERFVAQGGDWGSLITTMIGAQNLGHCAGIHVNMPVVVPSPDQLGDVTEEEMEFLGRFQSYDVHESGYSKQQSTRPQTLGYGLADSPSGQAGWVLEKFWSWTDNDGHPEHAVSRDELLDNVMFYWLNNAAASSGRLYWESFAEFFAGGLTVSIPTGISQFKTELTAASRRWADGVYTDIRHWNQLDRGGHFAAFEEPDLFVEEIRAGFRHAR